MEIEIKLRPASRAAARAAFSDEGLFPALGETDSIEMHTVYYTDRRGVIPRSRWMLRLRRENEKSLCAFKAPPVGSARLELEHPAADIQSGAALLCQDPALPKEVRAILQEGELIPLCGARFTRLVRRCAFGAAVFDLALDEGILTGGGRTAPLLELELELVSGPEDALKAASAALSARHELEPLLLSKQQQAMALCTEAQP